MNSNTISEFKNRLENLKEIFEIEIIGNHFLVGLNKLK